MPDIMVVLGYLNQGLDATTLRQLGCVSEAMLAMIGRVTMRALSHWTTKGGSSRTLQRFFLRTCELVDGAMGGDSPSSVGPRRYDLGRWRSCGGHESR